uniref:Serine/threonine protein phosphatase 7 long form isogeny n=1 Tax=Cajanus cajan TaxID=3821 RepID=A0A151U8J0_CAJCA|nr:Serine/threonine protein phosphatase 7 long form isogeny [Cajanus cajan]
MQTSSNCIYIQSHLQILLIKPLLEIVGFAKAAKVRHFKFDHSLITSLVERWRTETHAFHLPMGECTVTLQDVALYVDIKVDGRPVTKPSYLDWGGLCGTYLSVVPPKEAFSGSSIKIKMVVRKNAHFTN